MSTPALLISVWLFFIHFNSILSAFFDFDPPLEDLSVDVDVNLYELGDLEPIVKPYIIDPVKRKVVEVLKSEVKELVQRIIEQDIPGLGSLMPWSVMHLVHIKCHSMSHKQRFRMPYGRTEHILVGGTSTQAG